MQVRIAVVGQGTGDVIQALQETRLQIEYTPTKVRSFCNDPFVSGKESCGYLVPPIYSFRVQILTGSIHEIRIVFPLF